MKYGDLIKGNFYTWEYNEGNHRRTTLVFLYEGDIKKRMHHIDLSNIYSLTHCCTCPSNVYRNATHEEIQELRSRMPVKIYELW